MFDIFSPKRDTPKQLEVPPAPKKKNPFLPKLDPQVISEFQQIFADVQRQFKTVFDALKDNAL